MLLKLLLNKEARKDDVPYNLKNIVQVKSFLKHFKQRIMNNYLD